MSASIECPHCHRLIPSRSSSSNAKALACIPCQQVDAPLFSSPLARNTSLSPIPHPIGIRLHRQTHRLRLSLPHRLRLHPYFASFSLWMTIAGLSLLTLSFFQLSSSPWWSIGLLFGCYALAAPLLARRFNQLHITISPQHIRLHHGPFSIYPSPQRFSIKTLQQLYIRKSKTNTFPQAFALCAVLKNRRNVVLVDHLRSPTEALFLERTIKTFLKM